MPHDYRTHTHTYTPLDARTPPGLCVCVENGCLYWGGGKTSSLTHTRAALGREIRAAFPGSLLRVASQPRLLHCGVQKAEEKKKPEQCMAVSGRPGDDEARSVTVCTAADSPQHGWPASGRPCPLRRIDSLSMEKTPTALVVTIFTVTDSVAAGKSRTRLPLYDTVTAEEAATTRQRCFPRIWW